MGKIRVLVVDDSAVVREILAEKLSAHPRIEVVATAVDPYAARAKIARNKIDVMTLDIEMPRMDGLVFLRHLMKYFPIPTIIVSSLADRQNEVSIAALELGAVDIVPKPGGPYSVEEIIDILTEKILAASEVDFAKVKEEAGKNRKAAPRAKPTYLPRIATTNKIIAVGASTGGTSALEVLFKGFEPTFPPTAAVIHMPERFTTFFAERLDKLCAVSVKEARDGEKAAMGTVYIAPGNYHLRVRAEGSQYVLEVRQGPKKFGQRPAVDPLFESVAAHIGRNGIGVLLTGMGRDGAEGLLAINRAGGRTIAQDEATSIVFGMPKAAIDLKAADMVLPIERIAQTIAASLSP